MTHAVTMPEPELQRLPLQECAYALSIALACFAAWAWLSSAGVWAALYGLRGALSAATPGFVLLAVLSFIIQIAANVAAAAARQAQAADLPKEFERARTLMLLGGAYNAISLHHAFTLVGFLSGWMALLTLPLSIALAFYEPAQYWVDEALAHARAERKARADAQWEAKQEERRERLAAEDRARRAASERAAGTAPVADLDTHRRRKRATAGKALAAAAAAASPMAANALEHEPRPAIVQSAERPAEARVPSMEEVQDARYQLHMKGVTPSYRTVAAHIGVRKCDIEQVWPKGQPLAWESAA